MTTEKNYRISGQSKTNTPRFLLDLGFALQEWLVESRR